MVLRRVLRSGTHKNRSYAKLHLLVRIEIEVARVAPSGAHQNRSYTEFRVVVLITS